MRHDPQSKAQTFTSQDERDRWQVQQYGRLRNGFREDDEAADGRPLILYPAFWRDDSEELTYQAAVEANPRKDGEGALTYIARIAAVVSERYERAGKALPGGMSKRQRDQRQMELQRQADAMRARLPYKDDAA